MTVLLSKEHTIFDGHIKISTEDGFETNKISQNLTGGTAFIVNPDTEESIIVEFFNYWQNCNITELIRFHFKILSSNSEALDSTIEEIRQLNNGEVEIPAGFDLCYTLLGLHESNPYGKNNYRYTGVSLGFLFSLRYKLIIMVANYKPLLEKTSIPMDPMINLMKTFKVINFEVYINYRDDAIDLSGSGCEEKDLEITINQQDFDEDRTETEENSRETELEASSSQSNDGNP